MICSIFLVAFSFVLFLNVKTVFILIAILLRLNLVNYKNGTITTCSYPTYKVVIELLCYIGKYLTISTHLYKMDLSNICRQKKNIQLKPIMY